MPSSDIWVLSTANAQLLELSSLLRFSTFVTYPTPFCGWWYSPSFSCSWMSLRLVLTLNPHGLSWKVPPRVVHPLHASSMLAATRLHLLTICTGSTNRPRSCSKYSTVSCSSRWVVRLSTSVTWARGSSTTPEYLGCNDAPRDVTLRLIREGLSDLLVLILN
jgi:hypothetical protein